MYYEEQIINGVLCWRNDPDGPWTTFSHVALSERVLRNTQQIADLTAKLEQRNKDCAEHMLDLARLAKRVSESTKLRSKY